MIIIKSTEALRKLRSSLRTKGNSIGFVPTMGALHAGHLSLIAAAQEKADVIICSIFVNPTQFNNTKDLALYPRTPEKDIYMLQESGCDILYLPTENDIYPAGWQAPRYALGALETVLEGAYRPGHYQGVCMVVERLLKLVEPDHIFLGKKDYQQCMVLNKMISNKKLEVQVHLAETVRMDSGLARSSRNERLSAEEITQAAMLYASLCSIKERIKQEAIELVTAQEKEKLEKAGFRVDYLTVVYRKTLEPAKKFEEGKLVILVAAFLGDVRLIDNIEA